MKHGFYFAYDLEAGLDYLDEVRPYSNIVMLRAEHCPVGDPAFAARLAPMNAVLQWHPGEEALQDPGPWFRARLAGTCPELLARVSQVGVGEEWYGRLMSGEFDSWQLVQQHPGDRPIQWDILMGWLNTACRAARENWARASIIVDGRWPPERVMPDCDVLGLDAYFIPGRGTFAKQVIQPLDQALASGKAVLMVGNVFEGGEYVMLTKLQINKFCNQAGLKAPQVFGLLWFMWGSTVDPRIGWLRGVREFPRQRAHIEGKAGPFMAA